MPILMYQVWPDGGPRQASFRRPVEGFRIRVAHICVAEETDADVQAGQEDVGVGYCGACSLRSFRSSHRAVSRAQEYARADSDPHGASFPAKTLAALMLTISVPGIIFMVFCCYLFLWCYRSVVPLTPA